MFSSDIGQYTSGLRNTQFDILCALDVLKVYRLETKQKRNNAWNQLVAETMLRHHVCAQSGSVMYVGLS